MKNLKYILPIILTALLIAAFSTVLPAQGFPTTNPSALPAGSFFVVQQIGANSTGVRVDSLATKAGLGAYLPLAGGTMTGNLLMTSNKIIGGSTTTSDLNLQTTTGVGATGADMHFLTGSNGGTEAMTILNSGNVGIGTTGPSGKLDVQGVSVNDSPTYSAELLSGTGWTSTGWAGDWATGWIHTVGNTSVLSQSTAAIIGTKYQIAYTVTNRTAGYFTIAFGGMSYADLVTGAFGPTAISTNSLNITPTTDFDGTIVISIKSITAISSAVINLRSANGTVRGEVRANNSLGNTFNGVGTGAYNTTGLYNTGDGFNSLYSNTTGNSNTGGGMYSLYSNTTGLYNTGNGYGSIYSNTDGIYITSGGYQSTYYNISGNFITSLGAFAGTYTAVGNNTTSSLGVYLGYNTKALANAGSNEIVIGSNTTGNGSNTVTLGNSGISETVLRGYVGVGTEAPSHLVTIEKSSNSASSSTFPTVKVKNTLGTKGDGITTFNDAEFKVSAGADAVIGGIWAEYTDVLTGFQVGTADSNDVNLVVNDIPKFTLKASGNVGIGTTLPDRLLHPELAGTATTTVTYPLRLTATTTNMAAAGFGPGIEFEQEGGDGANDVTATVEAVATNVGAGTESSALMTKLIRGGTLDTATIIKATGQVQLMEYGAHAFTGTPTEFLATDVNGNVIERTAAELLADIGAGSGVTSFETRTGAVVSANGDYTASEITNVPAGGVAAITVQAAIDELDTEKLSAEVDGSITNEGALSVGAATTSTSQIATNTSGDGGVIIKVGSTTILSESADTIAFAISDGVYTPTLFNTTNIAASTAYECQYLRVGNTVTVSGKVDIDATLSASTLSELGLSLPIASDLSAQEQLGGTASSDGAASLVSTVKGDATNDRALFSFLSLSLNNDSYFFEFTYRIR